MPQLSFDISNSLGLPPSAPISAPPGSSNGAGFEGHLQRASHENDSQPSSTDRTARDADSSESRRTASNAKSADSRDDGHLITKGRSTSDSGAANKPQSDGGNAKPTSPNPSSIEKTPKKTDSRDSDGSRPVAVQLEAGRATTAATPAVNSPVTNKLTSEPTTSAAPADDGGTKQPPAASSASTLPMPPAKAGNSMRGSDDVSAPQSTRTATPTDSLASSVNSPIASVGSQSSPSGPAGDSTSHAVDNPTQMQVVDSASKTFNPIVSGTAPRATNMESGPAPSETTSAAAPNAVLVDETSPLGAANGREARSAKPPVDAELAVNNPMTAVAAAMTASAPSASDPGASGDRRRDQNAPSAIGAAPSKSGNQQSTPASAALPASSSSPSSPLQSGPSESGQAAAASGTGPGEVDRVRFLQRVAGAFRAADEQGGQIRLRLSPPELGSMKLELTVRDGLMTAHVQAETETARNLLLDHLPQLRERLADHQIKIDHFDVELMNQSKSGTPQNFAGGRDAGSPFSRQSAPRTVTSAPATVGAGPAPLTRVASGRLDVTV